MGATQVGGVGGAVAAKVVSKGAEVAATHFKENKEKNT